MGNARAHKNMRRAVRNRLASDMRECAEALTLLPRRERIKAAWRLFWGRNPLTNQEQGHAET